MKVDLLRFKENSNGCPGDLIVDGERICLTYEPDSKDPVRFQVPVGNYRCFRVPSANYGETFEVEVPGHTLIRFHWGNKEEDTMACILTGLMKITDGVGHSKTAFNLFMKRLEGINEFELEIKKYS